MSHQIDRVLSLNQFPEILLLWIGHNNLDWVTVLGESDTAIAGLSTLADRISACYQTQLQRLLEAAARQNHPVCVIVFALVNFKSFFRAREQAETIKRQEPSKYPYLEVDYRYFRSMRPEFRKGMIELADGINSRLKNVVVKLQEQAAVRQNVEIVFSTAIRDVQIDKAEMLNDVDAWHPSAFGHRMLAAGAFPTVYRHVIGQRGLD